MTFYSGVISTVTFTGMGFLKISKTGHPASVRRHAASNSSFRAFPVMRTFRLTLLIFGWPEDFSASASASIFVSVIWLFLAISANIVTAQSANAMSDSSSALGPVSVPPLEALVSHTTLCVRVLSAMLLMFSTHFARAFIFAIYVHLVLFVNACGFKFESDKRLPFRKGLQTCFFILIFLE